MQRTKRNIAWKALVLIVFIIASMFGCGGSDAAGTFGEASLQETGNVASVSVETSTTAESTMTEKNARNGSTLREESEITVDSPDNSKPGADSNNESSTQGNNTQESSVSESSTQENNPVENNSDKSSSDESTSDKSSSDTSDIASADTQNKNISFILKKGDKGSKVTDIQKRLDVLGYNLPLSGYYGNDTYAAVKDFQENNSLEATGNIDTKTYEKLKEVKLLALGLAELESDEADVKDTAAREAFANKNGFASYTGYFIWVNKASFNVTVFKGKKGEWKSIKEFPCTIGKGGSYETPTGIFQTGDKGEFFRSGNVSAKYYTRIVRGILFHTILFDSKGKKLVDTRLRMKLSHGCIRLEIPNAIYIYENIPQGTTVFIN